MSKEYFLQRLEYLLSDVPQEEREAALSYYRDYFEEAGAEKEQEVLNSIGSPEKVASEIKSSFFGDADKGDIRSAAIMMNALMRSTVYLTPMRNRKEKKDAMQRLLSCYFCFSVFRRQQRLFQQVFLP